MNIITKWIDNRIKKIVVESLTYFFDTDDNFKKDSWQLFWNMSDKTKIRNKVYQVAEEYYKNQIFQKFCIERDWLKEQVEKNQKDSIFFFF